MIRKERYWYNFYIIIKYWTQDDQTGKNVQRRKKWFFCQFKNVNRKIKLFLKNLLVVKLSTSSWIDKRARASRGKRGDNRKFDWKKIESAEAWLRKKNITIFFRRLLHVSATRGRANLARQLTSDGINMIQEVARSNCRFLPERLESCGEAKHIKRQRRSFSL